MVELRCNTCPNLAGDFCVKMKMVLPNGRAKLYYGGAVGVHFKKVTYPSRCGINEVKIEQTLSMIVLNPEEEILE